MQPISEEYIIMTEKHHCWASIQLQWGLALGCIEIWSSMEPEQWASDVRFH
jgi:hypothetical protein